MYKRQLLEKQRTVPATYPMTVNSVRLACNQTSSRDPVVSYDEPEIELCLRDLRHRDLIRVVHADRGQRTLKFHQLLDERLTLAADERAIITVLLLRGPQTPGELRTNTRRMYAFPDLDEVEGCLAVLMEAEPPLVVRLTRAPGAREARVAHLLSGVVAASAPLGDEALAPRAGRVEHLEAEVASLREELAELRAAFEAFRAQF